MKYERPRIIDESNIDKRLVFACSLEPFGDGCDGCGSTSGSAECA